MKGSWQVNVFHRYIKDRKSKLLGGRKKLEKLKEQPAHPHDAATDTMRQIQEDGMRAQPASASSKIRTPHVMKPHGTGRTSSVNTLGNDEA
jgi:hypothetical protein